MARQVIHGGDLVTNLLEVAPRCEPAARARPGRECRLAPCACGALATATEFGARRDPRRARARARVLPAWCEGATLVVARPRPRSDGRAEPRGGALDEARRSSPHRSSRVARGHRGALRDPARPATDEAREEARRRADVRRHKSGASRPRREIGRSRSSCRKHRASRRAPSRAVFPAATSRRAYADRESSLPVSSSRRASNHRVSRRRA